MEISAEAFSQHEQIFERSLASVMRGSILDALSSNGMAVAAATDDQEALRICNLSIASGAIAAGISGSGPSIAIVCSRKIRHHFPSCFPNLDWRLFQQAFM